MREGSANSWEPDPSLHQNSKRNTSLTMHWKRPWCWERSRARERDDRGRDGWMASPTQWTWVWASSGSWWWTGKPSVLQSTGSHGVKESQTRLSDWTEWYITESSKATLWKQSLRRNSLRKCLLETSMKSCLGSMKKSRVSVQNDLVTSHVTLGKLPNPF